MAVEDDLSVRKMICASLLRSGYLVIDSNDPQDAIEKSRSSEKPINLVIADVIMPGMKGPEVFQCIREHHPKVKELYMSGYTDNMIVHRGILDEGVQFIQKPFSIQTVNNKIKKRLAANNSTGIPLTFSQSIGKRLIYPPR